MACFSLLLCDTISKLDCCAFLSLAYNKGSKRPLFRDLSQILPASGLKKEV